MFHAADRTAATADAAATSSFASTISSRRSATTGTRICIGGERAAPVPRSNKSGRAVGDLTLRVPPGTTVKDVGTGEVVADLVTPGQEIVVARGGKGGRGNARFASSTQTRAAHRGGRAAGRDERDLELELRLIADVGLAGLPNAGKSSLLAALTRARPKIATIRSPR